MRRSIGAREGDGGEEDRRAREEDRRARFVGARSAIQAEREGTAMSRETSMRCHRLLTRASGTHLVSQQCAPWWGRDHADS